MEIEFFRSRHPFNSHGLGPPSAVCVQAVGTAMRCNPVSLVVPCHRVVRAGQGAGHYSAGTRDQLKVWLLQHEKCSSSN